MIKFILMLKMNYSQRVKTCNKLLIKKKSSKYLNACYVLLLHATIQSFS